MNNGQLNTFMHSETGGLFEFVEPETLHLVEHQAIKIFF
jgi:hypothetical protein